MEQKGRFELPQNRLRSAGHSPIMLHLRMVEIVGFEPTIDESSAHRFPN